MEIALTPFSLIANDLFINIKNMWRLLDQHSQLLGRTQKHFHSIVMSERALSHYVVAAFNNGLVSVNFRVSVANISGPG